MANPLENDLKALFAGQCVPVMDKEINTRYKSNWGGKSMSLYRSSVIPIYV